MAVDRMAQGRERADQYWLSNLSADIALQDLVYFAKLRTQAGGRTRPFRGPRMARFPSPRHTMHRGLRIPDLRASDDSPLSSAFHRDARDVCRTRRLPTQRLRRCGPNGIFRTRSRPCADGSLQLSFRRCRDAHAAPRR